jgi:ketosteroid isomerase-like protein
VNQFSDEELEAAFEANRLTQERDDWDAYCDLFTEDAVYVEHELGTFEGRDAIRQWLVPVMAPLVGWEYPIHWHLVGDGKVVTYWENVMPSPPGDDRRHSFFGISVLTYGGDGKWSRQEDVYNGKEMEAAMKQWLEAGGTLGTRAAS